MRESKQILKLLINLLAEIDTKVSTEIAKGFLHLHNHTIYQ